MSEDEKKESKKEDVDDTEEESAPADEAEADDGDDADGADDADEGDEAEAADDAEADGDDAEADGDEAEASDDGDEVEASDDGDEADEAPDAHGGHHAHDHKAHVRGYMRVFFGLIVLTVLEVGVAHPSLAVAKNLLVPALVVLALGKAAIVALYYMHLKGETKFMKWTVAFPIAFPALYAFILIAEGMYRARWGH